MLGVWSPSHRVTREVPGRAPLRRPVTTLAHCPSHELSAPAAGLCPQPSCHLHSSAPAKRSLRATGPGADLETNWAQNPGRSKVTPGPDLIYQVGREDRAHSTCLGTHSKIQPSRTPDPRPSAPPTPARPPCSSAGRQHSWWEERQTQRPEAGIVLGALGGFGGSGGCEEGGSGMELSAGLKVTSQLCLVLAKWPWSHGSLSLNIHFLTCSLVTYGEVPARPHHALIAN